MHRCVTGSPSRRRPDHNTHCSVGTIPSTAVICCCSSVSGLPGVGAFAGALLVDEVAIVLTAFDVEADAAGDGTVFCEPGMASPPFCRLWMVAWKAIYRSNEVSNRSKKQL